MTSERAIHRVVTSELSVANQVRGSHYKLTEQIFFFSFFCVYCSVFEEFDGRMDNVQTRVRIYSNGSTHWAAPFVFKTSCHIDVSNFPFDEQFCRLKFGSWRYDGSELNLLKWRDFSSKTNTSLENGEWEVQNITIERKEIVYPCCPNQFFPDVTFIIHLKRRSLFYVVNLIVPNFLIALLGFFSFFIPVECGERISFVITVMLSMTVFLLLVAESVPPTSEAVPVIGIFFTMSIVLIALALVATGFTLKIYYSYLYGDGLSPRVKAFLFCSLGPFLGFHTKDTKKTKEKRDASLRLFESFKAPLKEKNVEMFSFEEYNSQEMKRREPRLVAVNHTSKNGCAVALEPEMIATDMERSHRNQRNQVNAPESKTQTKYSMEDEEEETKEDRASKSRLASAIVDRAFMWLFLSVFTLSTIAVLLLPVFRSAKDHGKNMEISKR